MLNDHLIDLRIKELCGKNKPFKVLETSVKPEKCLAVINQNKVLKEVSFLILLNS